MCNPSETSGSPVRASSDRLLAIVAATLLLWAVAPGSASAQEQTFHACYVPEVGAMYLIQLTGLPSECLSTAHQEISWTDGGGATATDHGELTGLTDDDHPEYVREGEPAGGDLAGTFPDPSVAGLRGHPVSSTAPSDGQVLIWNDGAAAWEPQTAPSGVTDHGALGGLADDDHPQYLLADGGRALTGNLSVGTNRLIDLAAATGPGDAVRFEQAVKGGDAAGGDLTGTFPDPSVAGLQGNAVSSTAPSEGQVLTWNDGATAWEPMFPPAPLTEAELEAMITGFDHGIFGGLSHDDHPQYVLADGVRSTTDGFAVTGTLNTGVIPVEGAGTRMMWYPGKAAFRAGRVSGTAWDDSNVGFQSIALGTDVTASGPFTTAIGAGATADAGNGPATAIGGNTSATADGALAMGLGTEASGQGSTAIGVSTVASQAYATSMGQETRASGLNSTAMGRSTVADGSVSTALGDETTASGAAAIAMGSATTASANYSMAVGHGTIASADYAVAMGRGTVSAVPAMLTVGQYNVSTGGSSSFGPEILAGGNGTSGADRSNAFAFFQDGDAWLAGTLTESSDARLKTDIEPLGATLERLAPIRPVRFRFREGTGHPADPQIGLIAQEVQAVFPELVSSDGQGHLSLAYPKLTAVLLKGLQEQQAQIEGQKARNERLAERLDALETAMERIRESVRVSDPSR